MKKIIPFILFIGMLLASLTTQAQSYKRVPTERQSAPTVVKTARPAAKKIATLQKARNLVLKALSQFPINVKGGVQDGGGGEIDELELRQYIYDWSIRLKAFFPILKQMQVLNSEELKVLERVFFSKSSSNERLCVMVTTKRPATLCPEVSFEIFVQEDVWKFMTESQKDDFALEHILEISGVQNQNSRREKMRAIGSLFSKKSGDLHRYEIFKKEGSRFFATRNKRTDKIFILNWKRNTEMDSYTLNVQSSDEVALHALELNPKSPFFQITPCTDQNMDEDHLSIMEDHFALAQFQPLVTRCHDLVNRGQDLSVIWTKSGEELVVNCR